MAWTISSIRPIRTSPSWRKIPTLPLSRASAITFQAPASSSDSICSTHRNGAMIRVLSLDPTSESTVNSLRQALDQLELALMLERDRPVGELDVLEPELVQPRDQRVEAVLGDRQLGQGAAEHHR